MVKILRENNEIKQTHLECIKGATLLSKEEAKNLLTDRERMCTYGGEECWWWLRSPGSCQYLASIVRHDGYIGYGARTDTDDDCVRPALIISNLSSSNLQMGDIFELGGRKFKVISKEYALCEEPVGQCPFRKDWQAKDANVYEKSDIKKFVDNWFNMFIQDVKDIANDKNPDSVSWNEVDFGF